MQDVFVNHREALDDVDVFAEEVADRIKPDPVLLVADIDDERVALPPPARITGVETNIASYVRPAVHRNDPIAVSVIVDHENGRRGLHDTKYAGPVRLLRNAERHAQRHRVHVA